MNRIKKMAVAWMVVMLMLGLIAGETTVAFAAETGTTYLATANAYYAHPVTGVVEDPGNNAGIGQSMTESVLGDSALIEETTDGTIYATVRFFLMDNITTVSFWTQTRGGSDWTAVDSMVMQENLNGEYCSDFRFQIPAEDAVIKTECYVTAMGRSVIFYLDFSSLTAGSGDFVVSIDTTEADTTEADTTEADSSVTDTSVADTSAASASSADTSASENTNENTAETATAAAAVEDNTAETESGDGQTGDTGTNGEDTGKLSTTESASAAELLDSATGLTLSDESLLSSQESDGEDAETESTTGDSESGDETANTVQNLSEVTLSWIFVLQCILIIVIPAIIIGGLLLIGIHVLQRGKYDE